MPINTDENDVRTDSTHIESYEFDDEPSDQARTSSDHMETVEKSEDSK